MDFVVQLAAEFWGVLAEMAPYLLFGFFMAGLLSVFISARLVERHLGRRGFWSLFKAALFGVPLPLCSCGVIPVSMSLYKHGASRGATTSFLLSTPQTGVDSILVTYSLMGLTMAVYRPIAALITGLIGGALVDLTERRAAEGAQGSSERSPDCAGSCCDSDQRAKPNAEAVEECAASESCCQSANRPMTLAVVQQQGEGQKGENRPQAAKPSRVKRMFHHGFVVLPRDIGGAMLVGVVIAALISALVPDDFIPSVLGGGILAMLFMMVLGIPLYVCATASVPVAVALIAKGITPGAAMVFLMTGPATNAATFTTIWSTLGRRTAILYLATVAGCALGFGLLLDVFFPGLQARVAAHMHEMTVAWWQHLAAIVLLGLLLTPIVLKLKRRLQSAA